MSLNYGTLKTQILGDAHRPELTAKAADFVRQAEGFIARRLRCSEMITRTNLVEANRVSSGIYSLPADYLEERQVYTSDGRNLVKVGLAELRAYNAAMDVNFFCPLSATEIEFRGVPATDSTLELVYFARPAAFADDADENLILTRHEGIYINAGLAALYQYTQDLQLAQVAASAAEAAIETLNEQAGRLLAGARAGNAYNLSSFGAY